MRQLILYCFLLTIATACKSSRLDRQMSKYRNEKANFIQHKKVNEFILELSYMPSFFLPSMNKSKEDLSQFYYFRFTVEFAKPAGPTLRNRSVLYYGIDSLFTAGERQSIIPVLIEPIVNGSQNSQEYLVVFERSAFQKSNQLKVVFNDRLFTNTRLSFVFNRNKIEELESIIS